MAFGENTDQTSEEPVVAQEATLAHGTHSEPTLPSAFLRTTFQNAQVNRDLHLPPAYVTGLPGVLLILLDRK